MTPEQLAEGYAWCYGGCSRTARSGAAARPTPRRCCRTWRCRTSTSSSNSLWTFLIRHRLVTRVWRPLVELTRRRHLRFRARARAGRGGAARAKRGVGGGVDGARAPESAAAGARRISKEFAGQTGRIPARRSEIVGHGRIDAGAIRIAAPCTWQAAHVVLAMASCATKGTPDDLATAHAVPDCGLRPASGRGGSRGASQRGQLDDAGLHSPGGRHAQRPRRDRRPVLGGRARWSRRRQPDRGQPRDRVVLPRRGPAHLPGPAEPGLHGGLRGRHGERAHRRPRGRRLHDSRRLVRPAARHVAARHGEDLRGRSGDAPGRPAVGWEQHDGARLLGARRGWRRRVGSERREQLRRRSGYAVAAQRLQRRWHRGRQRSEHSLRHSPLGAHDGLLRGVLPLVRDADAVGHVGSLKLHYGSPR